MLEVQVLLATVLQRPREWVVSHLEQELTKEQLSTLDSYLARLADGEPLAYITGKRSFFGMDFFVTGDVLIPRPETELLVEEALQWLNDNPARRSAIDVGTGSGVIAISLADAIPDLHLTAIDISEKALVVARKNCAHFRHEDQIDFLQNDLLQGYSSRADLITANLPYIPTGELNKLVALRHEPRLALDGGMDGLDFIRRMLKQSVTILNQGGMILMEIESTISGSAIDLSKSCYPNAEIGLIPDYANLPRIVKIHNR